MIRPLVMLNRRSWVIRACKEWPRLSLSGEQRRGLGGGVTQLPASGWPLERATGLALRRRGFVAGDDGVDLEQVLGVARRLGQRLADEGRSHQLVVAGAVVALIGLQLDVVRKLEIAQRL